MTIKKIFFYSIFFLILILYLPFIINSFYGPIYPYAFSDLHINYSEGFMWNQKVFHSSLFNNIYDLVFTAYNYIILTR